MQSSSSWTYRCFQVKLDHTPQYAFGIKHSPYVGTLKGDAWGGSRTEAVGIASRTLGKTIESKNANNMVAINGVAMVNGSSSSSGGNKSMGSTSSTTTTKTTSLANGGTRTETTTVTREQFSSSGGAETTSVRTRVHADGHRIRSETFTSSKNGGRSSTSAVATAAANAAAKVAASRNAAEVKAIA